MKENKKFMNPTPVVETKPIKGSVGEFIEILKDFPADAKFTLNGNVDINDLNIYGEPAVATIKPVKSFDDTSCDCEPFFNYPEDSDNDECEDEEDSVEDAIMKSHLFGSDTLAKYNRGTSSDHLIDYPIMNPTDRQLAYEINNLHPAQVIAIDEIRAHNVCVVEALTEMYRRQLAALLEYNTQCMVQFASKSNKIMCEIVDRSRK